MAHVKQSFQTGGSQNATKLCPSPGQEIQHSNTKSKNKMLHRCLECQKSFCSPSKLKRHSLIHSGQRPFHCWECGKTYKQLAHLKTHQETHRKAQNISRPWFQKVTDYAEDSKINGGYYSDCQPLISEVDSFISPLPYSPQGHVDFPQFPSSDFFLNMKVSQQSLQFEQQGEVNSFTQQHAYELKTEEGQIPVTNNLAENYLSCSQTSVCLQSFSSPTQLRSHYLIQSEEKALQCLDKYQHKHGTQNKFHFTKQREDPESSLPLSAGLHKVRTQHEDSDHEVTTVQPSEVNTLDLNIIVKPEDWPPSNNGNSQHIATAERETSELYQQQQARNGINSKTQKFKNKVYQCVKCLKCFPCQSKLQRHFLIHTGQRPFGCHVCGKKFRQPSHLTFHKRIHLRPSCTKQRRSSMRRDSLSSYQVNYNSPSLLKSKENLPARPGTRQIVKMKSDLTAPSEREFNLNNTISSERNKSHVKHQCLLCFKCFTCPSKLQRHNLIHTGQKPFLCLTCGKAFRQGIHLKVHQQTHNKRRLFRTAFHREKVFKAGISSCIKERQGNESGCQGPHIVDRNPQGDLSLTECADQLTTEYKASDTELLTSQPSGANALTIQIDPNTIMDSEDLHPINNVDFQLIMHDGVESSNKFQLQRTSNDFVNNCQKVKRKTYECAMCFKSFPCPSKLQRHILIHTGQRPFSCHVCGNKFRQLAHMKLHVRTHSQNEGLQQKKSKEGSQQCPPHQTECDGKLLSKTLKSNFRLQKSKPKPNPNRLKTYLEITVDQSVPLDLDHIAASQGTKSHVKHQCLLCFKCFTCPSKLQRHSLIHTGQKPFLCLTCGKTFRQGIHLKVHQQTHNKRRLFRTAFHREKVFKAGISSCIKERQGNESGYQGPHIVDRVPQGDLSLTECADQLTEHTDSDTNVITSQDGDVKALTIQIKPNTAIVAEHQHPSKDDDFQFTTHEGKESTNKGQLQQASNDFINYCQKVKRKTYECAMCFKSFPCSSKLQRHILIHTGQRPFSCHVCGKKFRQLAHMKLHVRTHSQHEGLQKKKSKEGSQPFTPHQTECDGRLSKTLKSNFHFQKSNPTQSTPNPNQLNHYIEIKADQSVLSEKTLDLDNVTEKNKSHVKHQCLLCFKCFTCPSKLQRHSLIHTGQKPFLCLTCGKTFRQGIHLKVHQQTHNKKTPLRIAFLSKKKVIKQKQSIEKQPEWIESSINHKLWDETEEIKLAVCHPDCSVPHQGCSPPELQYSSLEMLDSAEPKENNPQEQPDTEGKNSQRHVHQCDLCDECFDCPYKLQRHYRSHNGQKTLGCYVFDRKFPVTTQKAAEHSEDDPLTSQEYQSPIRLECIDVPSEPQQHSPIHKEQKPYPICSKAFGQQCRQTSQQCTTEDSSYSNQKILTKTMEKAEQESCDFGANLIAQSSKSEIKNQDPAELVLENWHPVAPPVLKIGNIQIANIQEHSNRKELQCTVCLKSFNTPSKLSRHFLVHTGMKPFKCNVCGKSFRQRCHLQGHQQTHRGRKFSDVQQRETGTSEIWIEKPSAKNPCCVPVAVTLEEKLTDASQMPDCSSCSYEPNSNHIPTINKHCCTENIDLRSSDRTQDYFRLAEENVAIKIKCIETEHKCSECQQCFSSSSKLERHSLIHAGENYVSNSAVRGTQDYQQVYTKQTGEFALSIQEEAGSLEYRLDRTQTSHLFLMVHDPDTILIRGKSKVITEGQKGQPAEVEVAMESEYPDHYWCEPFDGQFNCEKCYQSFDTEKKLQLHNCSSKNQASDTQLSFYQCAICFKNFKCPSKLKRHYVIHTGQRPFKCSFCGKTYTQSGHLKTHQLTHSIHGSIQ